MKYIITIILLASSFFTNAQVVDPNYQNLFDLFIMDDYQECYDKAVRMIEKDKHNHKPEPYIFCAKSTMKLAQHVDDFDEKIKLVKSSLKYGAKYVKYKNKLENRTDFDALYQEDIVDLKNTGLEMAVFYIRESNLSKSLYYTKKTCKLMEDKPSIQVLKGLAYLLNRNHREGINILNEGIAGLNSEKIENEMESELVVKYLKAYEKVARSMKKHDKFLVIQKDLRLVVYEDQFNDLMGIK